MSRLLVILAGMVIFLTQAPAQDYKWKTVPVDGKITGCKASTADNIDKAIGVIGEDGSYQSPSGKKFTVSSATAKVAAVVLNAQSEMVDLKKVIAYSDEEMLRQRYESPLSNWFVRVIMDKVSSLSGKKCDVGICNFGGIRQGMPEGDVLLDDIQSMFPFKNYLVHLEMKGSELRKVFESMARNVFQAVAGVQIEVVDKKLVSVSVAGQPLEDEKVYDVATISFLLNGGDGLRLADGSLSVNQYDVLISDAVLEYVSAQTAEGKSITPPDVQYVVIR